MNQLMHILLMSLRALLEDVVQEVIYILKMSKITNGIRVEFIFNDPEDATFFLLKWM